MSDPTDPRTLAADALALLAASTDGEWHEEEQSFVGLPSWKTSFCGPPGIIADCATEDCKDVFVVRIGCAECRETDYSINPADMAFIVAAHNELVPALAVLATHLADERDAARALLAEFTPPKVWAAFETSTMFGSYWYCTVCGQQHAHDAALIAHAPSCRIGRAVLAGGAGAEVE